MKHFLHTKLRLYSFQFKLLLLILFQAVPLQSSFANNVQKKGLDEVVLSVYAEDLSVYDIFNQIEQETQFSFAYEKETLGDLPHQSLTIENGTLLAVLEELSLNAKLKFKSINTTIHVSRQASNSAISVEVEQSVRGNVSSAATGEPIPGATVSIKGAAVGTATDINGDFSLTVPGPESVLIISFVGYKAEEVLVGNQSRISVSLTEDLQGLDEVIVVGYGTQKKINITGAVAAVDGEVLSRRPVTNAASMLQGRLPGVRVVQNSGQPGDEGLGIQIRGQGTFSGAGSNPLVLIDGVEGSLNDIDPNDIENVSVLKDAASASIYGSRAANGVILVTTKKGVKGAFKLDYHGNFAVHQASRMPEFITNSAEYMELWNEAKTNSGISQGLYTQDQIDLYRNATDRNQYPNTNWLDLMFNSAPVQSHYLSFNGGENLTTYNISLGYVNQEGVMKGFNYERYNFRVNLSSAINDKIRFGTNLSLKRGERENPRQGATDTFLSTLSQAPTYGPQLPDGSGRYSFKAFDFESNNKNPVAIVENGVLNKLVDHAINAQLWTEIELVDGLTWYTKAAVIGDLNRSKDWRPQVPLYNFLTGDFMTDLDVGGKGLNVNSNENIYTNLFSHFAYEKSIADKHHLNVQVGYSQEYNKYEFLTGYRERFSTNVLQELNAGSPAVQNASGTSSEWAIQSFFGRLGYNYNEKYLLEMNLRYDGTSRLSPDERWGAFPSISAGWRLTEESFIKDADLSWLDDLKFRASYGELGNQNIGTYPYQDILVFTGAYPFDNNDLATGVAQTRLSNSSIKWETTKITDIGMDLSILRGLNITVDWYRKVTSDILRGSQLTGVVGLTPPTINDGVMQNTGLEINLNYRNSFQDGSLQGLNYEVGFFIDRFRNELIEFGAEEISGNQIYREGLPWGSFYMLEMEGIFQSEEEINSSAAQFNDNSVPGDLKFKDQNNDGVINNDDRVVIGNPFPKFEYAFNLSASWNGIDLSAFFQGVHDRDIYVNNWGTIPFIQGAPPTVDWRNRWTEENPSTTMPRMYWGWNDSGKISRTSSYYLQDASYMRLKNLVVGYSFSEHLIEKLNLSKLRLYFSGDNLFTFTQYPGLDPERAGNGNFVNYPQNKIYSLGVQVQF
ncbi:SusC/RagA family TonB-linked outer membrane protein [Echinicola pacifica]|uniref:SusC/RagA family TonB-linked outer membrane protein n=1 Tax=Echinicola pacifica TaxID=346377 RepID=A0A918PJV0_9BACT|nr:TonB-dependent receptor [Echinicola pacifica]GGZ12980.1 SusC/RagA family TonB-linked outer membrane protein [Echinicola pacifica]